MIRFIERLYEAAVSIGLITTEMSLVSFIFMSITMSLIAVLTYSICCVAAMSWLKRFMPRTAPHSYSFSNRRKSPHTLIVALWPIVIPLVILVRLPRWSANTLTRAIPSSTRDAARDLRILLSPQPPE